MEKLMEEVKHLAVRTDPMLSCCLCGVLLKDAVQLKCLHNCCQSCFAMAASQCKTGDIACSACGDATPTGAQQPNSFIDQQVRRYIAIAESRTCRVCKDNGDSDKPALQWCPECKYSLCGDCLPGHRQYQRMHVTKSLEDLERLEDVCPQSTAAACRLHKKPLEIACLNCEQAKCLSCWIECQKHQHTLHIAGDGSFETYVGNFIAVISSEESALLEKARVLKKPKSLLDELKAARVHHLKQINQRKRRIVDAIDTAYQEIECLTKNAYDDLEAEAEKVSAATERITLNFSQSRNYIRRLLESNIHCEILNQQKVVRERLKALSAALDFASNTFDAIGVVNIDGSLPEDLEAIVKVWIGVPSVSSDRASRVNPQDKQVYSKDLLLSATPQSPDVEPLRVEAQLPQSESAIKPTHLQGDVKLTKLEPYQPRHSGPRNVPPRASQAAPPPMATSPGQTYAPSYPPYPQYQRQQPYSVILPQRAPPMPVNSASLRMQPSYPYLPYGPFQNPIPAPQGKRTKNIIPILDPNTGRDLLADNGSTKSDGSSLEASGVRSQNIPVSSTDKQLGEAIVAISSCLSDDADEYIPPVNGGM